MAYRGETPVEANVSMVIIRACSKCGGKREADKPCATCGNPDSPVTHDVGVQAFHSDNPLRQLAWELMGRPRAERRAQRANREARGGNRS